MSLDPASLEIIVRRVVAEQFNVHVDSVTRATRFIEDLAADSLDVAEVWGTIASEGPHGMNDDSLDTTERMMKFESEFAEGKTRSIRTVGDLIDFILGDDDGSPGIGAKLKRPPGQ